MNSPVHRQDAFCFAKDQLVRAMQIAPTVDNETGVRDNMFFDEYSGLLRGGCAALPPTIRDFILPAMPADGTRGDVFVHIVRMYPSTAKGTSRVHDALFALALRSMANRTNVPHVAPDTGVSFFWDETRSRAWMALVQTAARTSVHDELESASNELSPRVTNAVIGSAVLAWRLHNEFHICHGDLHCRNLLIFGSDIVCSDFELACSDDAVRALGGQFDDTLVAVSALPTGSPHYRLPLLRSIFGLYQSADAAEEHISNMSSGAARAELYDRVHWSHARAFFAAPLFLSHSPPAWARDHLIARPFRMRKDIDIAMLVASMPCRPFDQVERPLLRALMCNRESSMSAAMFAALSWCLVGVSRDHADMHSPQHLLPYSFCEPQAHHACAVAAHSVRDAIAKSIVFPFADASFLLATLLAACAGAGARARASLAACPALLPTRVSHRHAAGAAMVRAARDMCHVFFLEHVAARSPAARIALWSRAPSRFIDAAARDDAIDATDGRPATYAAAPFAARTLLHRSIHNAARIATRMRCDAHSECDVCADPKLTRAADDANAIVADALASIDADARLPPVPCAAARIMRAALIVKNFVHFLPHTIHDISRHIFKHPSHMLRIASTMLDMEKDAPTTESKNKQNTEAYLRLFIGMVS